MNLLLLATSVLLLSQLILPADSSASESATIGEFHNGLSLQGFTGVLNTPSAYTTREGVFYGLYSNQRESQWRNTIRLQDNYFFNVGFFGFAEIGARISDSPKAFRDLSASLKLTSEPFIHQIPYIPVLAAGIQDISGGASLLKTTYVVASQDIWRLRFSAGYGKGPDRMKGVFAGGEFKTHDWLYLLADYDTRETNVGARVVLPYFWKVPVNFTATVKSSLTHQPGNMDIAVGFSLPLDFKVRTKETKQRKSNDIESPAQPFPAPFAPAVSTSGSGAESKPGATLPASGASLWEPAPGMSEPAAPQSRTSPSLTALRDRLVAVGFMNVRVREGSDKTAVIEYENSIFNHNEMDALGVVTGLTVENLSGSGYEQICIVIRKKNIRMLKVTMPFAVAGDFLAGTISPDGFRSKISISNRFDKDAESGFTQEAANSSFLTTSFVLWPGLSTLLGVAENGGDVLEYRLSVKPDIYVNLWKGGLLNARWDIPVSWSSKMDDGKMDSIMERVMLFQGIKLLPDVMLNLGAGMLLHDLNGTMNEITWQPGDGSHRLRLAQTWGRYDTTRNNMESYLASYRYLYSPLDLSLEGTYGRFWYQDRGFSLQLKRFFGDSAVAFYYKNTKDTDRKTWEAVGVEFSFPLTPQKDMKHFYKLQLRGTEEWAYSQETTLKNTNKNDGRGALNYLADVPLAVQPNFTGSLYSQYEDRGRLNRAYLLSHLDRIRDAWNTFRSGL